MLIITIPQFIIHINDVDANNNQNININDDNNTIISQSSPATTISEYLQSTVT